MNASQDIQALLAAFRIELPDPQTILFPQKLGEFTVFPKLPIEIRLEIWNLAFPAPRHVDLLESIDGSTISQYFSVLGVQSRGKAYHGLNLLKGQFPVTLSINKESRGESLKHYKIIFVKDHLAQKDNQACRCDPVERYLKVPFWINPSLDFVYFDRFSSNNDMQHVLERIEKCAPDVLPAIRTLRIRDMTVCALNKGTLQYFPGLEELTFTWSYFFSEETNKIVTMAQSHLQMQKEQGLRAKIPKVHFTKSDKEIQEEDQDDSPPSATEEPYWAHLYWEVDDEDEDDEEPVVAGGSGSGGDDEVDHSNENVSYSPSRVFE